MVLTCAKILKMVCMWGKFVRPTLLRRCSCFPFPVIHSILPPQSVTPPPCFHNLSGWNLSSLTFWTYHLPWCWAQCPAQSRELSSAPQFLCSWNGKQANLWLAPRGSASQQQVLGCRAPKVWSKRREQGTKIEQEILNTDKRLFDICMKYAS